jgi:uncharacterized membrane protein
MTLTHPGCDDDMNKDRFEAFSDGVFAFAITLLILGVALPSVHYASERELRNALIALWPNVIAFALSFAVIAIMWQNHQALFRFVNFIDRRTVFLNLPLLAGTVFIPFVTSTLGTYPTMHASTFLYGVVLTYCGTCYNLLLEHLIRRQAFAPTVTELHLAKTRHAFRVGAVLYLVATLLALILPVLSFAAYVFEVLYYLVPRGVDADLT